MLRKGMRRETEGNKRKMGKNRGESRDMAVREGRLWVAVWNKRVLYLKGDL